MKRKRFVSYKKTGILIACMVVFSGLIFLGLAKSHAVELDPVLSLGTPMVKMSKESEVVMMGTGFEPGQTLNILITAANGTVGNIGLDIKADATGTFEYTWKAGRYVSKKLIVGGAYKIEVTDVDYTTLGQNAVIFINDEAK